MVQKMQKGYVRNGQAHLPVELREQQQPFVVSVGGKNNRYLTENNKPRKASIVILTLLFVVCMILLLVISCGFVGFSYYLYERLNNEVQNVTHKINCLNEQIVHLRERIDNLPNKQNGSVNNIQNMLQSSVARKFTAVAIDNIEEYMETDDLDEPNEVENDEYQDDAADDDTDRTLIDKSEETYNNYHPANISFLSRSNGNSSSDNGDDNRSKRSNVYKRNALLLYSSNSSSRSQVINNKNGRHSTSNNGLEQNSDLLNDNKRITSREPGKPADKKCMITIPLEDFINHFRNYHQDYDTKMQEMLNKTIANCSTLPANVVKQNMNRRSKYNFKLKSNEEEDGDSGSVESIMANRRKLQADKNSKLREGAWRSPLDVEILSENANDDEAVHMQPREAAPIAVHAGGRAINYVVGQHCYEGNGRLCHPNGEMKDWMVSNWFEEYKMHQHFTLTNGKLKVHKSGLYFVYSQILFADMNDHNGYYVLRNTQVALQCLINIPTAGAVLYNTCYTGGIIKCNENDVLSIKVEGNRYVKLVEDMSYFGMFRVADSY